MNLTKLFNFDYLIQNIKKSKSIIILLMLLLPTFSCLMLISLNESSVTFNFPGWSAMNIVFMYLIPVALSVTLFDFVHKRTSADFMGSMPLSRKTIFATNTLGGGIIILAIQLVTAICTFIVSRFLNNILAFDIMILETFIYYTIGYFFVFVVSNLAMSFSGNAKSQIATTILILFIIPFLISYFTGAMITSSRYEYQIGYVEAIRSNMNLTIPSFFMDYMLTTDFIQYNAVSIIKTIVVSIIYIILGYILFNKKKFELAGESFENNKVHFIIKSLTLVPFVAIYCDIAELDEIPGLLIFLAIMFVYYFVFDLITNKKQNILNNVKYFIVSMLILFALFEGIAPNIDSLLSRKNIALSDVNSITLEALDESIINVDVNDKELIDEIKKELRSYEYTYDNQYVKLILNDINGDKYHCEAHLSRKLTEKILDLNEKKNLMNVNNMRLMFNEVELKGENGKKIKDELNKIIKEVNGEEFLNLISRNSSIDLVGYTYIKHDIKAVRFDVANYPDIANMLAEISNEEVERRIDDLSRINVYDQELDELIKVIKKYNPDLMIGEEYAYEYSEKYYYDEEITEPMIRNIITGEILEYTDENYIDEYEIIDFVSGFMDEEIIAFVKSNIGNKVDMSKEYVSLNFFIDKGNYNFKRVPYFTNNVEEFYKLFAKCYNEQKEQKLFNEEI